MNATEAFDYTAASAFLTAVAFAHGGYFPLAIAAATFTLAWLLSGAVLFRPASFSPAQRLLTGGLGATGALVLLRGGLTEGADEALRCALYVTAAGMVALFARSPGPLFAAVATASCLVATYALATRMFPERLGVQDEVSAYRLAQPLGYWNALGLLAALGIALCVGFVARGPRGAAVFLPAVAIPPLATTVYLTFSRGAWLALASGLVVTFLVDPRRTRFAFVAAACALTAAIPVAVAASSDALTGTAVASGAAIHAGHRLGVVVVASAAVAGLLAPLALRMGWLVDGGRSTRLALNSALSVVGFVALSIAVMHLGGPSRAVSSAYGAFQSVPPAIDTSLNERLLNLSGSYRAELWRVALGQAQDRVAVGSGPRTFERRWLRERQVELKVRDAHSLYLETFAELGAAGLAFLLLALSIPVYAALRARRHPLVPAALGAYAAFLVHAGVDWDWEVPAVSLAALVIGAAIVVAARGSRTPELLGAHRRVAALALAGALLAASFVALAGHLALARSAHAARVGSWAASIGHAERARSWAPWSPDPYRRIGDAELALGWSSRARASYRRAIEKAPRDWSLWFDLARVSSGVERRRALARAAELNPLSPEIARFRKELRQ